MEEKSLVIVSLLCCLIGTLILIFLSGKTPSAVYPIQSINASMEGSDVVIQGYLYEISSSEKLTRFKVKDSSGSITSVVFEGDLSLKENSFVQIKGMVTLFNNKTELTAKEIYSS